MRLIPVLLIAAIALIAGAADEPAQAAKSWLALVDAGRYGDSWVQASPDFKKSVTRQQWIEAVTGVRALVGKFESRKLDTTQPMKDPPNAPPGDYLLLQYTSSFANKNSATETVILSLSPDKHWRTSGYFVK